MKTPIWLCSRRGTSAVKTDALPGYVNLVEYLMDYERCLEGQMVERLLASR